MASDPAEDASLSHRSFAAIVASHVAGHPEFSLLWRRRLQLALLRCKSAGRMVLFTDANPIGRWVELFADRLDVPHLRVELPECKSDGGSRSAGHGTSGPAEGRHRLRLERLGVAGENTPPELSRLPLADRVVAALADEIWAIEVRPNSKTAAVVSRWLDREDDGIGTAAVPRRLFCFGGAEELFRRKLDDVSAPSIAAVPDPSIEHCPARSGRPSDPREAVCRLLRELGPSANLCWAPVFGSGISRGVASAAGRYLIHCTRGRQGGFAGQSSQGYAADLLLCEEDLEPSPFETLIRILRTGRIAATSLLKRDATSSVSFADVPLAELLARRGYQQHLRRWDWEPYGLAICRDVLETHFGVRPVQYLPSNEYRHLPESERWLFQPSAAPQSRDWTAEREWRCPVDVRLSKLDFADALVFAATREEAAILQRFSRFAVLAVGQQ